METLKDRIQFLEKLRGIPQAEATRLGGFGNQAFINDIMRGHKESVRGPNIAKLALAYRTTASFLLGDTKDPDLPENGVKTHASLPDIASPPGLVLAVFGGLVEAGSFRSVDDFDDPDPDRPPRYEPRDKAFPHVAMSYFEVAGDSMNKLEPRSIMPGDHVVCLDFEGLLGRVPLRDGMVVVVEQTLDGGHHRERSVKQIELYDDRIEFHPRSRNPRHKPIVVPLTVFRDASEEDSRKVVILALVRRISNELPLW